MLSLGPSISKWYPCEHWQTKEQPRDRTLGPQVVPVTIYPLGDRRDHSRVLTQGVNMDSMRPLKKPGILESHKPGQAGFGGVQPGAGIWNPKTTQSSLFPPKQLPKACWEQPGASEAGFALGLSVPSCHWFSVGGEGPGALKQSLKGAAVWELSRNGDREGETQGQLHTHRHRRSKGPQTVSPALSSFSSNFRVRN